MTDEKSSYAEKYRIDRPAEADFMEMLDLLCLVEDMYAVGENYAEALDKLNSCLKQPAGIDDIRDYYGFQDETDFIISRCVPDYRDFRDLPDEELLWLISGVIDNMEDDYIPVFYCAVIDYNTSARPGRCNELIFLDNMKEPVKILETLKAGK